MEWKLFGKELTIKRQVKFHLLALLGAHRIFHVSGLRVHYVNKYHEMKIVIIMKLASFSLRLFVGIRTKTKIPANINMWQTHTALNCVLSVGVAGRTTYGKHFAQLGLTATLFILWHCLHYI
jgi:hypothetical protein